MLSEGILSIYLSAGTSLFSFLFDNLMLLVILGGILVFLISIVFRISRKKKKQFAIQPVTDILGNVPERVQELNREIKPFGFAYDPTQDIFYSLLNPWQRRLGYCRLYDEASAAFSMIIDCEPLPFEYGGRRWLIEFWKGQYGMNTGGEVGIYYTTEPNLNIPGLFTGTFYFCPKDEECIYMSFAFRKNGNLLFTRSGYHWWLTGFKLGEFSHPDELSMEIVLDLYDWEMASAFEQALKDAGYQDDEYDVDGRRVTVLFDKPHTKQPFTRTALTEFIMQSNNEHLCNAYNYLTSNYSDTLDKLEVLKNENPSLYDQIMTIGKPRDVFESYSTIKDYVDS